MWSCVGETTHVSGSSHNYLGMKHMPDQTSNDFSFAHPVATVWMYVTTMVVLYLYITLTCVQNIVE